MKLSYYLLMILLVYSCSDEESKIIDKDQLTLGTWYYEYQQQPDGISNEKSTTLTFNNDGSYKRENKFYSPGSPSGVNTVSKEGMWSFENDNIIDLTDFGTCVQPVGGPPCVPPDINFKIIQLTKELLEVEELNNGSPAGRKPYRNIKL